MARSSTRNWIPNEDRTVWKHTAAPSEMKVFIRKSAPSKAGSPKYQVYLPIPGIKTYGGSFAYANTLAGARDIAKAHMRVWNNPESWFPQFR